MGLQNYMKSQVIEEGEILESMTDEDQAQLLTVALEDACTVEELDELVQESANLEDLSIVEERSIIKLDKIAKRQRSYKLAILQVAKDADDQDYKKLCTLWKMEKFILRKLEKKYAMKAKARVKQTAAAAAKNGTKKTSIFKKAVNSLTRSQIETNKALHGNNVLDSRTKTQSASVMNSLKSKIK